MIRALVWKEWREQRPVVLSGIAFAIIVPLFITVAGQMQNVRLDEIVQAFPVAFLGIMWPLMAAAAGAITIASEEESGTARFLLSRPVARRRLWAVKVAVGFAAFAVIAAFSLVVTWFATVIVPGAPSFAVSMQHELVTQLGALGLAGFSVALFACAVLASTLMTRPLTAAAAGLAIALTLLAGVLLVWSVFSLVPRLEPQWFATEMLAVALLVLLASLAWFARAEIFAGGRVADPAGGTVALAAPALLLVVVTGALPGVYAGATYDMSELVADPASVVSGSGEIVMTMSTPSGGMTQIWSVGADGSRTFPLTGRHTLTPVFFPGTRWIVYRSRRGPFGGRSGGLDLRAISSSGMEDRLVMRDVPAGVRLFFRGAASGRLYADDRLMFVHNGRLTIAQIDGGYLRSYSIEGEPIDGALVLGFNAAPDEELLFVRDLGGGPVDTRDAPAELGVFNVRTRATRVLRDLPSGWRIPGLPPLDVAEASGYDSGWRSWAELPVIVDDTLELIDAVSGEAFPVHGFEVEGPEQRIAFERCAEARSVARRTWMNAEGRSYREQQMLFGDCTASARAEGQAGLIRLRGLRSAEERVWSLPEFDGSITGLWLSRNQDQVLIAVDGTAEPFALLLNLDGATYRYPDAWRARGWITRESILFQGERDGGIAFATSDPVRTPGRLRDLYPRPSEER